MKQTKTLASGFPVMFDDERAKYMAREVKYEETIESLRQQLAEKDAEIERLKTVPMKYRRMAFNAQLQDENNELRQQLVASQAREQQLREALNTAADKFHNYAEYHSMKDQTRDNIEKVERNLSLAKMCDEALAIPADTAALEALITESSKVMRERCADAAEDYNGNPGEHDGTAIGHLIRALPGVKMGDLQK